jgi:hypothetical protein
MAVQLRLAARQLEEFARAIWVRLRRFGDGRAVHERQVASCHDIPSVGDDLGTRT